MSAVVITQDRKSIARAIERALEEIDLERLIAGRRVAVKPNETYADKDDVTGVTQPDTLRAVLRYVKRFGPRELIVTGGSGAAETDEVMRVAGLMDVVEATRGSSTTTARPSRRSRSPTRPRRTSPGRSARSW